MKRINTEKHVIAWDKHVTIWGLKAYKEGRANEKKSRYR